MDTIVGKIQSLSCENFVTYDQITIFPGRYLNLILGPNGTGKSSLVAAIVLGMGGDPKLLSRSSDIRDYVKNGKEKSWIEVKIYIDDDEETVTFRRSFDLSGKSVYKVDGSEMNQKQYLKNIAQYNIQIANPCQFLPQDKVQDFAKMNPQELLTSTQAAVCTEEMNAHFAQLKEHRKIQQDAQKNLTDNQKRLKELEDRNAQIENIIEKMEMRQRFLDDVMIGEKKKAWLEFDELLKDFDKIKEIVKKAQHELKRDEKALNACKNKSRSVIDFRENLERSVALETGKIKEFSNQLDKLEKDVGDLEDLVQSAERDLKGKKADMRDREKEIQNATLLLQAFLADLQNAMESCGTDSKERLDDFNSQINAVKKEIISLTEKRADLNHEIDCYQPELNSIRNRINKMGNEGERRLNNLRQNYGEVYNAVMWLRANRHMFQGTIYEPMLLELRVKDAKNAIYVENTISYRDLLAFTCVDKSDVKLLIEKLCNEQKLKINVLHSDEATSCNFEPKMPIKQLEKFGFYSYLLDMIDGPAPLLNFLCKVYQIHNVLIGTTAVEQYSETLPHHIQLFFSNENRFQIIVSRYSSDISSMCSKISEKNLLRADVDERQIKELKYRLGEISQNSDALKNRRNNVESEISNRNEKVNEIMKNKTKLEGKLNQILEKKRKLKYQEQKITELQNTVVDIPTEEQKFRQVVQSTIRKILDLHRKKVTSLAKYEEAKERKENTWTKLHVYKNETVDIDNQLRSAEEDYSNSKKRSDSMEKTRQQCKDKCDQKESEALELCNGKPRNHRSFPYKDRFAQLPDSLTELEDHLIDMKTRADCMTDNQADITEYESRKVEIKRLQKTLDSVKLDDDKLQALITEIHNIWYPYFMEKVTIINENFSKFMSMMEYAGEVNLTFNDEHDYDSYGIQILVQYRNAAKLQALDRFIQSGGERAVAIAIYSMSLQNLTSVPFRCVDEINQGMDPTNERKVFNLIVDKTCQIGSAQYFFITPKLLPDLHYNELLTAIVIFNGDISRSDIFQAANQIR